MESNEPELDTERRSLGADGEQDCPTIRQLLLDHITIDTTVQARAEMLGDDIIEEYAAAMRAGDRFAPLVVYQHGETYILADGFTRHAAATRAEITTIDCEVREGTLRDAKLFAVGANATHGRPRSAADKRHAVLKMLEDTEWSKWSDRRIAQLCRVSHQLVGEVRSATGRATSEVTYKGRYGVRKMKVGKIGKAAESIEAAVGAVSLIDGVADVGELGQVYAVQTSARTRRSPCWQNLQDSSSRAFTMTNETSRSPSARMTPICCAVYELAPRRPFELSP
jgi:ParB-like nuclease domain